MDAKPRVRHAHKQQCEQGERSEDCLYRLAVVHGALVVLAPSRPSAADSSAFFCCASVPQSIRVHEEGRSHKEAVVAHQKSLRATKAAALNEANSAAAAWEKLDQAAQASYQKDLQAAGGAATTTTTTALTHASQRGPPPTSKPAAATDVSRAAPPSSAPPSAPTPSPWQSALDPTTGATYYYNINTMETRWDPPDETPAQEKKKSDRATQKRVADDADESKSEPKKKPKTEGASATADTAASTDAPAPAPVEIDEDTGFGAWSTVESAPEPTPEEVAAAEKRPRQTPFGMVKPAGRESTAGPTSASTSAAVAPQRYSTFAADDADDADEDDATPVDVAQQLRNQFGPSRLIHAKAASYEAGVSLLDDGTDAAAAPTVTVTFKKKSQRQNQRKPIAATNK